MIRPEPHAVPACARNPAPTQRQKQVDVSDQGMKTVLFDLGGVLIRWNPRNLFQKLFPDDPEGMEAFLSTVCTPWWNLEQDQGRSLAEGTRILQEQAPEHFDLIAAYYDRWEEMLAGEISENVELLREIASSGRQVLAITDWSAETFPIARRKFDFLDLFQGIVVSGEEKCLKPSPKLFGILQDRYDTTPDSTIFIDDSHENVDGAAQLGYDSILYSNPTQLRSELAARGVVPELRPAGQAGN